MSTSSISSMLSSLESASSPTLDQLLGQSSTSTTSTAKTTSGVQDAVNAILNSATNTSGSGIDVQSTVNALLEIEAQPEQRLVTQVQDLNTQTTALQSIQTDLSALQTTVQALSDPLGAFGSVSVYSNDNSVVSATATSGADLGTHTIQVNSLATTSAYYSKPLSSTLSSGSLDIRVGSNSQAVTVPVDTADGTTTLKGLVAYINKNGLGVTASVLTDATGSRLSLVSQTSGAAGSLTITDNTGTSGSNGMGFTQAVDSQGKALGADASLLVDGIPVTSSSNTVTGAISGVTLTLTGVSSSPVPISVQPNLSQVATAINSFVTAYNKVMTDINTQYKYDGTQSSAPPLLGDPSLDLLQSQLLAGVTTSISGNSGLVNLQSIGIQLQVDGTLSVASASTEDSTGLNDALTNNFAAVRNLFQSGTVGVAQVFNTQLTTLTSTVNGPLSLDMAGITRQATDLNTQIANFQLQLQKTQTALLAEYSQINVTLEQMPQLLAQISSQLDAINPSKS